MANPWIEETLPQVISSLTTQHSFKSQFSALTTNADRVQFCLTQKEVQRWLGLFVSKFSVNLTGLKCSTTAGKFREKGNYHFRLHKFEAAIQLYSRAICFAPQRVDEAASELALAFGNRSAAYFQVGQHENALKDMNDALAFGYGEFKSVIKLQLRKCDCLIRLGRASEAKEFLNFMQKPKNDENDIKRWIELFGRIRFNDKKTNESNPKSCDVSLISKLTNKGLFKSNEKMSLFSAKVAVQYDEVKGRHLIAQEDIEFGDILAFSQPYISLLDSKVDVLKYCDHCCRDISLESTPIRPIACIGCSSVVYCSEECRTESANSYHRYECGQTDLLAQFPKFARMSLRMLYRAGMDQIRSVVDSSPEEASHLSEQPEGHYSHVYQLVHHSNGPLKDLNISFEEMLKSSILAYLLLQLAKNGNFPMHPKEEEKLIGAILLRHLLQLRYNIFDFSLNKENESPVLLDLFPLYASTLNHSCRANARLESPNSERVSLLQAAQSISAGTEITIPYMKRNGDRTSSQMFPALLKSRYLFECFCVYCAYCARNTPFGVTGKFAGYLGLSCSACGHLLELSSEHRSESELFSCISCRKTLTNAEMKERYRVFGQLTNSFSKLYHSEEKPVWKMLEIVEQVEAIFHRDSNWSSFFRNCLGQCYFSSGQMDKWWACIEQYISVFERISGKESVDLMEAFNILQKIIKPVEIINPIMMKVFEQQDSELYQRYLARMEQSKQLKRKYYKDY